VRCHRTTPGIFTFDRNGTVTASYRWCCGREHQARGVYPWIRLQEAGVGEETQPRNRSDHRQARAADGPRDPRHGSGQDAVAPPQDTACLRKGSPRFLGRS